MLKRIIFLIILFPAVCLAKTPEKIPELIAISEYRFPRQEMTKDNVADWLLAYMTGPSGIAVKDNYLYVSDTYNHRLVALKISSEGKLSFAFTFGRKGSQKGEFYNPQGLLVRDNYLYVADSANRRIQALKINSDGTFSLGFTFGKEGRANGEFLWPNKLATKGDYLYVSDGQSRPEENHRIQVLRINPDGTLTAEFTFGKKGESLGEFNVPEGLAVKDNYLYVAEAENNRIQALKIDKAGKLSSEFTFGKKGRGSGEFFTPHGLATRGNSLYVCDAVNSYIQILKIANSGKLSFLFQIGNPRGGNRLGDMYGAEDLVIKDNYLFMLDYFNNRVQVFKIGERIKTDEAKK